jgi:hypothetical protein
MISLSTIVSVIIWLIVVGLVFWLLLWLIGYVGLPEPFNKIAHVVLAIAAVLILIAVILSLAGGQPVFRP